MLHIQFGFNHYQLKSYSPIELGLLGNEFSNIQSLELNQRYFQINTVKCYASYKFWHIVYKNGDIKIPNADLQNRLLPYEKQISFQWKAYFLPILVIVLLTITWGLYFAVTIHKYQKKVASELFRFKNHQSSIIEKNKIPKIGDLYLFDAKKYHQYAFLIDSIFEDKIYFASYDSFTNLQDAKFNIYDPIDYINYMDSIKYRSKYSVSVDKKTLYEAIYKGEKINCSSFKGVDIPAIYNNGEFEINNIFRTSESDINISFYTDINLNKKYSIAFENNGRPCKIKSVLSKGQSKWELDPFYLKEKSSPYLINTADLFFVMTKINSDEEDIAFDLLCEESAGSIKIYSVRGKVNNPIILNY